MAGSGEREVQDRQILGDRAWVGLTRDLAKMGKLSAKIRELIARQVKRRGIVVWYDPERVYTKLVETFDLSQTSIVRYADGFFRLRHALEPQLEFVTVEGKPRDDCGVPPNVVIYVPLDRAESSDALVEAETAGVVVEPDSDVPECDSRLRLQAEAFFRDVAPEKAPDLARQVDEGLLAWRTSIGSPRR